MSEQLVPPYSALAEIYDQATFSAYAQQAIPRYIALAQSLDWAGRRVIDVGCGTGVTSWWLVQNGLRVTGVDNSPYMLAQARNQANDQGELHLDAPEFVEMDIRQLTSPMGLVDLVVAVGGVLNAIQSLRELETAFSHVNQVLAAGRMFIFDMRTIRGLAVDLGARDVVYFDNGTDLNVTVRNSFSFETLSTTRHYIVWRRKNDLWQRQDETHTERGYPTQGIVAMLQRTGFDVTAILNPDMTAFDGEEDPFGQAVFVAVKAGS
jgi:SAM-dependent methyltransferase